MRRYAKIPTSFWTSPVGRRIKALGAEAQVLAIYLLASPHGNMLGLFYTPLPFIVHETGLSDGDAIAALQGLEKARFCSYDHPTEVVWVYDALEYEFDGHIKPNDNQVKGIRRAYAGLQDNPFLRPFFEKNQAAFHLEKSRGAEGASEGPRRGPDTDTDPVTAPAPEPAKEKNIQEGLDRGVTLGADR